MEERLPEDQRSIEMHRTGVFFRNDDQDAQEQAKGIRDPDIVLSQIGGYFQTLQRLAGSVENGFTDAFADFERKVLAEMRIGTSKQITRAFLCYPPVGLYQRGEERCQADIKGSATQAPHAPNDLGYLAAQLKQLGVACLIRDYPAEKVRPEKVHADIKSFNPDIIAISTTYPTCYEDILFLKQVKTYLPNIVTIAKGSHFFSFPLAELKQDIYQHLDIAIYAEAEFIIKDIVNSLREDRPLEDVGGLIINLGREQTFKTAEPQFCENLDQLPFPNRNLIRNRLYKNPVNNRPMATIVVSRGCPEQCIFCLTPLISGRKLRRRSVQNVIGEIRECIEVFGIRDFFFRADTFTMDRSYVHSLCREIIAQKLEISWVANSRTDTVDQQTLKMMKDAGCWLIAFGIESGNDDIQKKIKKGTTKEQARRAVELCRQTDIKTFGFFMIGFPWDSEATARDTYQLARDLDCDFIEVHIAMPFDGTELNSICRELGLIKGSLLGYNYFSNPYHAGTLHLSRERIIEFRKKMISSHYLRPAYIWRTLRGCHSLKEYFNYFKYGLRLIRNMTQYKLNSVDLIKGERRCQR